MTNSRVAPLLLPFLFLFAAACVPASAPEGAQPPPATPAQAGAARPAPTPAPAPGPAPAPSLAREPGTFTVSGALEQGGWIRGEVPPGTIEARLDDTALAFDERGRFFAAFDRDAGRSARLVATLSDGRRIEHPLVVAARDWDIERVDVARSPGGATEAFMRIRRPELEAIWNARQMETGAQGWRQEFIWPVTGRISGRFGSQRIYRGEPGSYHSGIDITTGRAGTPFVAPADGIVVLAVEDFSLEGKLLIIDHGQGLNSAFLHAARLHVRQGDRVSQGQHIGDIGASGRATGPHLHWSLKWHDARLDPLLFTGPMG